MSEPRRWVIEPDNQNLDPEEIYWGIVLTKDPKQGPLHVQASRINVIEASAYDALKADLEAKLQAANRKVEELELVQKEDRQIMSNLAHRISDLQKENAKLKALLDDVTTMLKNKRCDITESGGSRLCRECWRCNILAKLQDGVK